jgi:hypothetical protein
LTTAERVALVLRAEARGDHEDRRRLMHDAPMKAYRITDPAVMDCLQDTQRVVMWLLAVERPALADANAVGVMVEILPNWIGFAGDAASHHVFKAMRDDAQRGEAEIDGLLTKSEEAVRESFETLLAALREREHRGLRVAAEARAAVDEVAHRVFGVDGRTLVGALSPVELQAEIPAEVVPDREVVAEMVEMLLDYLDARGPRNTRTGATARASS